MDGALHYAAWSDERQVVEMLVQKGAKIDIVNKHGQTPVDVSDRGAKAFWAIISKEQSEDIDNINGSYASVVMDTGNMRTSNSNDECTELMEKVSSIDSIFRHFQEFVDYKCINHVLNTTSLFKSTKSVFFYWKLNAAHSKRYYLEDAFKLTVKSVLTNPASQLSLDLSNCKEIIDVSIVGRVNNLSLRGCSKVVNGIYLGNVDTLDITNCYDIDDKSALRNVRNLFWHRAHKYGNADTYHDTIHCDNGASDGSDDGNEDEDE